MLYGVMCRAYPRCKPNLHVITPGVTLPVRPADSAANKAKARQLLGLPLDARLVAFVANDYWKKGLPTLLAALVALPADCQLAVVGSRHPTVGGRRTAREFAFHFASAGLGITSGLALGIDAASHDGALLAGGRTIAVLGTGLDTTYPGENAALARAADGARRVQLWWAG